MSKKIIIIPDSFKGTLTSIEAGEIIARAAADTLGEGHTTVFAIADGGEGTLDAFLQNSAAEIIGIIVRDPNFRSIKARYLLDGDRAIIELAQCAGLSLAHPANPRLTTTAGVGDMIADALDRGARRIILALGGSATNDCGAGMAVALGAQFFNAQGREFLPTGETLCEVCNIDITRLRARLDGVEVCAMCDVENVLHGKEGAAYVFAPQKGASDADVKFLDAGLANMAKVIKNDLSVDAVAIKGGGAAGGMGVAAAVFLGGKLVSGIDLILDACGFDTALQNACLVITGEGKLDSQSLMGKAVGGIAKRTRAAGVELRVIAGKVQLDTKKCSENGIRAAYACTNDNRDFEDIKRTCRDDLYAAAVRCFSDVLGGAK